MQHSQRVTCVHTYNLPFSHTHERTHTHTYTREHQLISFCHALHFTSLRDDGAVSMSRGNFALRNGTYGVASMTLLNYTKLSRSLVQNQGRPTQNIIAEDGHSGKKLAATSTLYLSTEISPRASPRRVSHPSLAGSGAGAEKGRRTRETIEITIFTLRR